MLAGRYNKRPMQPRLAGATCPNQSTMKARTADALYPPSRASVFFAFPDTELPSDNGDLQILNHPPSHAHPEFEQHLLQSPAHRPSIALLQILGIDAIEQALAFEPATNFARGFFAHLDHAFIREKCG